MIPPLKGPKLMWKKQTFRGRKEYHNLKIFLVCKLDFFSRAKRFHIYVKESKKKLQYNLK